MWYVLVDGGGDVLNRLWVGYVKVVVGGFGELIEVYENFEICIFGVIL